MKTPLTYVVNRWAVLLLVLAALALVVAGLAGAGPWAAFESGTHAVGDLFHRLSHSGVWQ